MWKSKDIGKAVMDMNFDPIEKDTFGKLMDFCVDLQSQEWVIPDSLDCWVDDLYDFTSQEGIAWVPSNKYAAQNYLMEWIRNT